MKLSTNKKDITDAIKALDLSSHFNTDNLEFEIRSYEKNEQIASPMKPLTSFVFILSGSIRIYHLDDDSKIHSIRNLGPKDLMGYNEFAFDTDKYTLYSEAISRVKVLSLSFRQPNMPLKSDSRFLMYLLRSYLNEHIQHTEMTRFHNELEDKLLFYIENICEHNTIENVNAAVAAMGCSRRQLQRILKKLCDDGVLTHEKRGTYILHKKPSK